MQEETAAAENPCAQRLLEADGNLNLRGRAKKAVAMNHVLASWRDFNRHDVPGQLGRKRYLAGSANGAVFGHKNRAASCDALDHAKQASAPAKLRVRSHLDGAAHPRKFSCLRDDGFVGFENELQHRHCGSGDAGLHVNS